MQYKFSGFTLDTEKKQLRFGSDIITITKQNYNVLLYFVKKPNQAISKDDLIRDVWKGRAIADNTVDQSIYKIRKILVENNDGQYFETVYGLGVKFLPEIKVSSAQSVSNVIDRKQSFASPLYIIALVAVVIVSAYIYSQQNNIVLVNKKPLTPLKKKSLPSVFVMSTPISEGANGWLEVSPNLFFENILNLSNKVTLKKIKDKPKNLNQKEFLNNQWNLIPDLKIVTTKVTILDKQFTVLLSIVNKQQQITEQTFASQNLNIALKEGAQWLSEQLSNNEISTSIDSLIPDNPYLLEMYLHGISAVKNEDIESAINFFEICLKEDPNYHLATLELAKLRNRKGEPDKALALLDTISLLSTITSIIIESENLRGGIFLRQGKLKEAGELFKNLITQYNIKEFPNLIYARYNLSLVYRATSNTKLALSEINTLESELESTGLYELRSNVYINKAGVLMLMGENEKAKSYTVKSLELYQKLGNLIGQSKAHSLYARIARINSNYTEAEDHLNQSLTIAREINYNFGIGGTLNELINVLIAQGKLTQAWQANQELAQIANKLSFVAMQLAAKQLAIEIMMAQKKWKQTNILLKEHRKLATTANHKKALFQNTLLKLDSNLSQNKTEDAQLLIDELQQYIVDSKETSKQPSLNLQMARYQFQQKNPENALSILNASLLIVKENKDNEAFIHINNLLASYYLDIKQPQKALAILESSLPFNPTAYPYLKLKSKAYYQLNKIEKAVEFASLCKRQSNDLWIIQDEQYLAEIVKQHRA